MSKIICAALAWLALSSVAYAEEAIKVGIVTPLSGTYAGIGQTLRGGFEMAAREINESGGVMGRKIELLFEDEEANPTVAVQKAEKLLQVSHVDFLSGTVNSASSLAVAQVAERNGKLASTTVSYADSITGERCSPVMFRVNARAEQQSIALASWVAKTKPKARVLYIGPDYEMGRSSVGAFRKYAEKNGLVSAAEIYVPLDTKDYTQFFGQVRAARAEVIYLAVAGNDTVRLFSQMQEFGLLKGVLMVGAGGTINQTNLAAIGSAAEGFVTGTGYSPLIDLPGNKRFVAAYRAAFKSEPDTFAADSYGMLYAYKIAVEKAKSTDTDKVRTALRGLAWSTPQGMKTIRAGDHQAIQDMYIVTVRKGQFEVTDKIAGADAIGPDVCTRF